MSKKLEEAKQAVERAETALRSAKNRMSDLKAVADRFPEEPPAGTVLRFEKTFVASRPPFTYAAIRGGGSWHLTGRVEGRQRLSWGELVDFIGNSPCVRLTAAEVIPPALTESQRAMRELLDKFGRASYAASKDKGESDAKGYAKTDAMMVAGFFDTPRRGRFSVQPPPLTQPGRTRARFRKPGPFDVA